MSNEDLSVKGCGASSIFMLRAAVQTVKSFMRQSCCLAMREQWKPDYGCRYRSGSKNDVLKVLSDFEPNKEFYLPAHSESLEVVKGEIYNT